jgi:uncharacterized UPF0160 family protein
MLKMIKKIGTHSGNFHCDEVMACYLLRNTKAYSTASITRTRDKSILDTLDLVVDVGDEFDVSRNRFDHHQKSFQDTFGGSFTSIRLSSAGLIWKYFGKEVIENLTKLEDSSIITLIHEKLYKDLFQSLDACDNGISQYDSDVPERYREMTTLPSRVSRLNPSWQDPEPDFDRQFYKAIDLVSHDFLDMLNYTLYDWLPARVIVEESIKSASDVDPSGKIVLLKRFCPWKEHIHFLEDELECEKIFYVLYEDSGKNWRIQVVGLPGIQFGMRLPLPEPWRGKRGQELAEISGIEDIVFVHATGFIGGAGSYESVLKMARVSLGIV